MEIIYKNSSIYVDMLSTIIKDIERIVICLTNLKANENVLLDKLDDLKNSLNYEKKKTSLNGVYITLLDNYLKIEYINYRNTLEINEKTDMMTGIENKILIKRNMREFYFYSRDIIHQVDEGSYITEKITTKWIKDHFLVKDGILVYDHPKAEFDELLNEKVYKKGSI